MPYITTLYTSIFKMLKGGNKMDNNYDEQFLVIQAIVEANKQDTG